MFITFEGTDGVGKTTHIRLLARWLMRQGFQVVLTREPGGGVVSEKIRSILLDRKVNISTPAELLLYLAARAEHVEKVILPALQKGRIVLCDRFSDATVAYQGYGRRLNLSEIHQLNHYATRGLKPHLTIWLDLPAKAGLKKAISKKRGKADRIEMEGSVFLNRVRNGYLSLVKKEPHRFFRIQVQPDIYNTQALIQHCVQKQLWQKK